MSEQLNYPNPEKVELLLAQNELDSLRRLLADIHPADIADLLEELDHEEAIATFNLLSDEVASEVLDETGSLVRQKLVEKVDDERLADLLDELPMDDAAEFLDDLPDPISDRLIELMEPEEAAEVQELLGYEEDSAGRLMTRDVAVLRRQWTVNQTLEYMRSLEDAETLHYLYVVDRHDKLLGVTPLRNLLMAQPDTTIGAIMNEQVTAVLVTADQEELAELVAHYDYVTIPVVDKNGRFLGIITVDDVLDVLEEEATEDIQRLGGSAPLDQPYFAASVFSVFRKRVWWLLMLFFAATLTGTVMKIFQPTNASTASTADTMFMLMLFVPLIIGTGGNAGSQTVATIIRAITLDEVSIRNGMQAWRREVSVGFLLGIIMGGMGMLRAVLWHTGMEVALVVALTLPLIVIWSTTIATLVPILAEQFKIDPAVISGPMITTIVDSTGLFIYFSLATVILGL